MQFLVVVFVEAVQKVLGAPAQKCSLFTKSTVCLYGVLHGDIPESWYSAYVMLTLCFLGK